MGNGKSVVHVYLSKRSKFFRKIFRIFFFAGKRSEVFEHNSSAFFKPPDCRFCFFTCYGRRKTDLGKFVHVADYRPEGLFAVCMSNYDNPSTFLLKVFYGWKRPSHPIIIFNNPELDWLIYV